MQKRKKKKKKTITSYIYQSILDSMRYINLISLTKSLLYLIFNKIIYFNLIVFLFLN